MCIEKFTNVINEVAKPLFSKNIKSPRCDCTGDKTLDSSEQSCNKYTECKFSKPPFNECKYNEPPLNECKFNKPPFNGKIVGNMNCVGDRIQYICDSGYEVPKESEYAVCQPDGKWSVIVDKCTKIKETNVALGKKTAMSSEFNGYIGNKGVDGNTNQGIDKGSCFHTDKETNPWWRVDLGAMYHIVSVTLFNRIDVCETGGCNHRANDLRLGIGTTLESMNIVGTVPDQIDDIHTFSFPKGKQARYVQVSLEGEKTLHLCEVQVFGFPIEETNAALGKQTAMSSIALGHDGAKGVDGNTNQDLHEGSCFHTNNEINPWWRVDLGAMYHIVNVTLFNRIDSVCETGGCIQMRRHYITRAPFE
ncbi:uncharacterized protein LOC128551311 [Mercenaria mercenaria]|uniref:uncharacterized protein LOC128551311 n=1 Tax=Mercenaria mercenaria TaxID=6596 RepID=UPI00234F62FC|nr:uncharacterized protein LOC128551311 [Mercenaria mercenaria]